MPSMGPLLQGSQLFNFAILTISLVFGIALLRFAWISVKVDYQCFLRLGPGALPSTPWGYLKSCWLRRLTLPNVFRPPSLPKLKWLQHGYLDSLPIRPGLRPTVDGIAPHRQVDQKFADMYPPLLEMMSALSARFPERTYVARSKLEKHNTALFARYHTFTQPRYHGEIVHAHPVDGSMHLTLHPGDLKTVIEAGWGERHPLAREWRNGLWTWVGRFWAPVPSGFVMLYAPRGGAELKVVEEIVKAAMWWIAGVDARVTDAESETRGEQKDQPSREVIR